MPRSFIHILRKQKQVIAFLAIVLAVLGFGLVTYFVNLREASYDITSKGFRPTGGVGVLELGVSTENERQYGRRQQIPLRFSAKQAPISGIQIIVDIKGNSVETARFEPVENISGLQLMGNVVENIEGGRRIKVAFASSPLTTPFNNNVAFTTLGHYVFSQPTGQATIEFLSDTKSTAPETGADTLAAPAQTLITYHTIESTAGATPTTTTVSPTPTTATTVSPTPTTATTVSPTPTTATTVSPTPTTAAKVSPTPTTAAKVSPTPTATAVANNDAGTGGTQNIVVLSCNSECQTHSQCPVNTFCSSGRCRNTACSGSENCVCPTASARASTAFTGPSPTPRAVAQAPRTQPRTQSSSLPESTKGGDDIFVDTAMDPQLADDASQLEERLSVVTPTPSSVSTSPSYESDGMRGSFIVAIAAVLAALVPFVIWRRRRSSAALNRVAMKPTSPVSFASTPSPLRAPMAPSPTPVGTNEVASSQTVPVTNSPRVESNVVPSPETPFEKHE